MEQNPDDAAIVRVLVALGQSLGITTLAGGVESAGQLDILSIEGCEEAQEFLLGRPMQDVQTGAVVSVWDQKFRAAAQPPEA